MHMLDRLAHLFTSRSAWLCDHTRFAKQVYQRLFIQKAAEITKLAQIELV
jgi:hypothetical protein